MTPKFVIFDCDGVLVDSEPVTIPLLAEEFARHGLRLTAAEIARDYTGRTIGTVAEMARAAGARLPPDWIDATYAELFDRLARGCPLIAGVPEVLDRLDAAGIGYAVASNGPLAKMEITLGQHPEIYRRVDGRIYSAHSFAAGKPDPQMLLQAAEDAGVAPAACAVIDDSVSGCTAGIRGGMDTYGFAEQGDGAVLAATGATVFHRMAALPALLGL